MLDNDIEQQLHKNCIGCSACYELCPKNAISLNDSCDGFYKVSIDKKRCISCKKCLHSCNEINHPHLKKPILVVCAQSLDETTLIESSSGGFYSELCNYVLRKGGFVYGAAFDSDFIVNHERIESEEELYRLRGSKYVQSNLFGIFEKVKNDLVKGKYVLFSGTPCQVSGLKVFLGNDYQKLITVDLFCHGCPNPSIYRNYLLELKKRYKDTITEIAFRGKYKGWDEIMKISFKNKKTRYFPALRSSYYKLFLDGSINNPACNSCDFKNIERIGDFSIGDCWNANVYFQNHKYENGATAVLVNNEKAFSVFELIKKNISFDEIDLSFLQKNNISALSHDAPNLQNCDLINGWKARGYSFIEEYYKKKYRRRILINKIGALVPRFLKKSK